MKTLKNYLTSKTSGSNYTYIINDKKYSIDEFNNNRGWCVNTYEKSKYSHDGWTLVDSYGYNGLTLKKCKEMIVMELNETI
tara:strand:+ start:354 stop:596 length:243 start_codon:yes stop_codon:yes gene_type:complete